MKEAKNPSQWYARVHSAVLQTDGCKALNIEKERKVACDGNFKFIKLSYSMLFLLKYKEVTCKEISKLLA